MTDPKNTPEITLINVYGSPSDPEWDRNHMELTFKYLKAKINVFELDPEPDDDNEKFIELIKEIGESECDQNQRISLLTLMGNI